MTNTNYTRETVWVVSYEINRNKKNGYDSDWWCWSGDAAKDLADKTAQELINELVPDVVSDGNEIVVTIMHCPEYPMPTHDRAWEDDEYSNAADEWNPWDQATETRVLFTNEVAA